MKNLTIAEGQILHLTGRKVQEKDLLFQCNVCGYHFKRKELYDDPELGFVCYPDKARIARLEAADRRFEWECEQSAKGDR